MKLEHREVIDAPVGAVWKAFEDPEVIAQWQSNLLEFEQLEGSFTKVGGVARMKAKQVGMTNEMTVTVLERDARKRMVKYHYEGAQAPFEIRNTFKSLRDGSTEWTAALDVKLSLLTQALGPVLKPLANEFIKGNGKSFRAWCEAEL